MSTMKKMKLAKSNRSTPKEILKEMEIESLDTVSINDLYVTFFDDQFKTKVGFVLNIP